MSRPSASPGFASLPASFRLAGSRLFILKPPRSDHPGQSRTAPRRAVDPDETFDDAAPLQHPDPPQGGLRADRRSGGAALCLRPNRLRLRPYRQRAAGHRVRRAVPSAAAPLWRRPRNLRAQHHRRRRQDQCPRRTRFSGSAVQRGDRPRHRGHGAPVPRGCRSTRDAPADRRAAGDRHYRADARPDRAPSRTRRRLCRRGPCALLARRDGRAPRRAALWGAGAPLARRDAGRGARRCRPLQARPDGFRAVETVEAERAELAEPGGDRGAGRPAGISSARRCRWRSCSSPSAAGSPATIRP